jgi:hypothetical protein
MVTAGIKNGYFRYMPKYAVRSVTVGEGIFVHSHMHHISYKHMDLTLYLTHML